VEPRSVSEEKEVSRKEKNEVDLQVDSKVMKMMSFIV
jgi:hypothetical protein